MDEYKSGTPELYESGSESIVGYGPLLRLSAEEIFSPDSPPVIYCTQSGAGKTSAAVAAVYANRARLTGLFYISSSYHDSRATYLQRMIPSIHVKNFDMAFLCDLWGTILKKSADAGRMSQDRRIIDFISRRAQGARPLAEEMERIQRTRALNALSLPSDTANAIKVAEMEARRFFIRNNFRRDDPSLSPEEREIVKWCQSSTPLPVVIFDDVTPMLKAAPSGKFSIPKLAESGEIVTVEMSGTKALDYLLISIFTTMRRNGVGAFFVHSLEAFSAPVRQQAGAFILDEAGVIELCRESVIAEDGKRLIRAAWEKVADSTRFKYHRVVYYADPSSTSHGQRVAIYKPPYYSIPEPLGVPTYKMIVSAILSEASARTVSASALSTEKAYEESRRKYAEKVASSGAWQDPRAPQQRVRTGMDLLS